MVGDGGASYLVFCIWELIVEWLFVLLRLGCWCAFLRVPCLLCFVWVVCGGFVRVCR